VFQILKHAERHFAAGHGYLATVVGVEEEGLIHLSLTGQWMCCMQLPQSWEVAWAGKRVLSGETR